MGTGKPKSSSQTKDGSSGWGGPSALRGALRRGFVEEMKPEHRSRVGITSMANVKCTTKVKVASLGLNPDLLKIWFLGP